MLNNILGALGIFNDFIFAAQSWFSQLEYDKKSAFSGFDVLDRVVRLPHWNECRARQ
jgi:hypothetical protein